jgi:excisionase family DNA binding protein
MNQGNAGRDVRRVTVAAGPPDPRVEMTLRPERAAEILGVSVRAVHKAIDRGDCPVVTIGRLRRIPTAQFLAAYGLPDPTATPASRAASRTPSASVRTGT